MSWLQSILRMTRGPATAAALAALLTSSACVLKTSDIDDDTAADPADAGSASGDDSGDSDDPGDPDPDGGATVQPAGDATLSGSVSVPQLGFGDVVDLSATGATDWAHWGLAGDVGAYNHRGDVAQPISDVVQLGEASLLSTNCCIGDGFSWAEGTPTSAATDAIGGIYVDTASASGDGFRLVVPADRTERTVRLYTGNWCVRAKLTATLSDASAGPFVDTSFDVPGAELLTAVYEIDYAAADDGQSLTIDFTIDDNHCTEGDVGELHLFAAAR